jgi:hypothetical protein
VLREKKEHTVSATLVGGSRPSCLVRCGGAVPRRERERERERERARAREKEGMAEA